METVTLPRLMISAAWKSSGKTMVSLGILHNLVEAGNTVKSFKKGPDYIDPMWHALASGRECHNLDPYLMGARACQRSLLVNTTRNNCTMALVEGNHGLHDGMDINGTDSTAGLASILDAPVLLVVDSRRTNRGVAAQVMGMQAMPPRANIAGVILNRVQSARQADKQKLAIEKFCKVPVLGVIPEDGELVIPERHLGLTTVGEASDASAFIRGAAGRVARFCDMQAIIALFATAPPFRCTAPIPELQGVRHQATARIGVFRDTAFCFYYPDNFDALRKMGAELVFINSFTESSLPDIDALYLGGGFPESFFEVLSGNRGLLGDVSDRIAAGMPAWAECGGLIYLGRSATYEGITWPLAGVLPLDVGYQRRPAGCGYCDLRSRTDSAWFRKGEMVRGHEFHYSRPSLPLPECLFQCDVLRGFGADGKVDGALRRNLFASYLHLHAEATPEWAGRFVSLAARYRVSGCQ